MADTNLRIKIGLQGTADVNAGLRAIGAAASSLKTTLLGITGAIGGIVGLGAAIQQSVRFNAELERQAVAFKTLLGNADAASRRMAELARFAAQTPFELPEIVQASKILQSLTNGALASGDGLRLVGDAAAATGRPLEEVSMWVGRLYAGLQSGTPVGEATMRLLEMGLISGTTARRLNDLAESGEGAGQAMTILRDTFGRLGGAMSDQSQTFSGLLSTLRDTFNMALADIGKPLFDALKAGIAELIPIVEDVGARVGAWSRLALQSWRDGRLGEFIGLTIEAGVEYGIDAFADLRDRVIALFTNQRFANSIGNASVTIVAGITKAFIDLNTFFQSYWNAVGVYAAQAISAAIRFAINQQIGAVEKVLAAIKSAADLLVPGASLLTPATITLPRLEQTAPNFDEALAAGSAIAKVNAERQKQIVDALVASYRDFFAIEADVTNEGQKQIGAREKLKGLIDQLLAAEKARKDATGGADAIVENEVRLINVKLELQKLELAYNRQLQQINQARGAVEASWLMTANQKFAERKRLLEQELALIAQQVVELEKLKATATEAERVQIEQRVVGLQGTAGGIQNQMVGMGPAPESFSENFQATVVQLQNQFGTVAQQMAATFADVFNTAISSISSGITGLIMGTMTWGQALMAIGTTILTTIVQSIVQMGVRWIATQILMATVGKSIMAASLAATMPIAAASSAVWATPATLATIASYGSAAAAAPGFIAGAQGMVLAQSLAAFRSGGYTGDGNPNEVAGIVHRGEFVVPADAVARIGLANLEAIKAGVPMPRGDLVVPAENVDRVGLGTLNVMSGASTEAGGFTSPAAPAPITLNMGVFDNPARLNDWAKSNEGRTVLVDIMRQHAHEFSMA